MSKELKTNPQIIGTLSSESAFAKHRSGLVTLERGAGVGEYYRVTGRMTDKAALKRDGYAFVSKFVIDVITGQAEQNKEETAIKLTLEALSKNFPDASFNEVTAAPMPLLALGDKQ